MNRIRILVLAVLMTAAPMADAAAQSRDRQEQPRDRGAQQEEDQRISLAEAERSVRSGRNGRYLNANYRGNVIVVRWAYPDGRIADITVDARSGRIIGER
ncbi:hypothetical protein [uncultured Brevundimonas sp.]|uniref:hypothetical protein n=1 Tax=uncultured Brevundimonas sp. TaxID=213418 RepID=UPI0030EEACC0|tara:strand:- start:1190 stop:1489 length:300 start_codon:yes stop_codon:yes gene_type:complete